MEVIFKDVNQGDSIIVKWVDADKTKIGLIDCHSDNGNPSLKHIIDNSIEEIEFVLISHPHFDHFSGVVELFEFCARHSIPINYLGFTFDNAITYSYGNFANNKARTLLAFFDFLSAEKRKGNITRTIKHSFSINSDTKSKKFSEFDIDFLRPTQEQVMSVAKSFGKLLSKTIKTEPNLNEYSSVIEIRKDKKSILLTSDAPKNTFKSLKKYYQNKERVFHLVQIPHHGSSHNHYLQFWKELRRTKNCPSVFSVGGEVKDELPDSLVVNEISNENYTIYSTNIVYGIADYLKRKPKKKKPTIMVVSAKVHSKRFINKPLSQYQGDKSFTF